MLLSLLYILLAILGLGFLVFIHELGHYWVARRKGMKVEAFAIGFGKPLIVWERDGVKWQICLLPFGGYVRIAGMQRENGREPSQIPDGFYGKKPWARIQVALAGPLVNIGFALIVFTLLWFSGGRNKPFAEFTHRIGWVDPKSALYEKGVRPGDTIEKYDGHSFGGFKDLLISSIIQRDQNKIEGFKVDYSTGRKIRYDYKLKSYDNPEMIGKDKLSTIGVLSPARYLIFQGPGLIEGSPMQRSGIQPGDRIIWMDGEFVFSHQQLSHLTNDPSVFVTVLRGGKTLQTIVPRVPLSDFKLSWPEKGELDDWQHEARIKKKLFDLSFIPYNLSPNLVVESRFQFIDEIDQKRAFEPCERCRYFLPLQEGDKIIALNGKRVSTPYELLKMLQTQEALMIVERDPGATKKVLWTKADVEFEDFSPQALQEIVSSIGTDHSIEKKGNLVLLKPIQPKALADFPFTSEQKALMSREIEQTKKEIEAIQDPTQKEEALYRLEKLQKKLVLGLPLVDREVRYNPTPAQQFVDVLKDTYRTLSSLISGSANPKYVAGPVGIVQIVHQSWLIGGKEVLFWMALISLNLGIINLLPLPVLDGGHIVFSVLELFTRKPMKAKTMEKLIIPFIALLIGFFLFVTYNDITRLFSKFF